MIYQLKYTSKEQAQTHLKSVGVLDDEEQYTAITEAVVYIGLIIDVAGTYDADGNELTPPTFLDGYHVDIMINTAIDFGTYLVTPNSPHHQFAI